MFLPQRTAEVAFMRDEPERAEPHLPAALALADDLGEADQRAQLAAKLAVVLGTGGRPGEAEQLAHHSRRSAPTVSVRAQALWRTAMAVVRFASGHDTDARLLSKEATALVGRRDTAAATEVDSLLGLVSRDWRASPTPGSRRRRHRR
jgi:hypothetical protein